MSKHILIVGAGLSGSLMACYLARAGHRVSVYERRSDPRVRGYAGGRSINLALSVRGLHGLAGAGLADMVMSQEAIAMPGRLIHPAGLVPGGKPVFQPYSHDPNDAIHSVSRGGLNLALIRAAVEHANVELVFGHPCTDVELDAPAAIFETPDGVRRVEADLILGADGALAATFLSPSPSGEGLREPTPNPAQTPSGKSRPQTAASSPAPSPLPETAPAPRGSAHRRQATPATPAPAGRCRS